MSRHLAVAASLILAVLVSSCTAFEILKPRGEVPPAPTGAPILTDSAVYHVRTSRNTHELTIGLVYRNPTNSAVYIPTCRTVHPPVLQKWEGGQWVTAYAPVVLECLGEPVVIAAGDSYAYTYHVKAWRSPNMHPRFEVGTIPGSYRLMWRILETWTPDGPEPGLGKALPLEARISNTFRIE